MGGTRVLLLGALAMALGACGESQTPETPPPPYDGPTWWKDVAPIVDAKCASCHEAGGIAPFAFDDYASVKTLASTIKRSVETRSMPPWPPGEGCGDFAGSKALSAAQIQTVVGWAENAANPRAEGSPADRPRATERKDGGLGLGAPDFVVEMPKYTSTTKANDDYHCFVIDPKLTSERDVIGAVVTPGNPKIVHHVILYEVKPSQLSTLEALDNAEDGPGYTCFGGIGINDILNARWVVSWAPGGEGFRTPEGTGMRLSAGSRLVMQVHYNLLNGRGEEDQTRIGLHYSPTPVAQPALILPIPALGLDIPAGEKNFPVDFEQLYQKGWPSTRLHGVTGHMHLLGQTFEMTIERPGEADACLIRIPKWDFHWQGMYLYQTPLELKPGYRLKMRCVYDNSRQNQPFVDGKRQEPRRVLWGESTLDEMCLGLLYIDDVITGM